MTTKNPLKTFREKNLHEAGTETVIKTSQALISELQEDWKVSMRQMLGVKESATREAEKVEGELKEGEEISFAKAKKEKNTHIEPGIDYRREIIHAETVVSRHENQELRQRLNEIQVELKKITQSSKELETTFKEVTKETLNVTVEPGKYHVNFFEWVLSTIQNARVRIESAATWINAISSKKSRKDYWSLSKKHGTSYSLSSERVVAQQVG